MNFHTMAGEKESLGSPRPIREKQTISVPFLWEVRPGTPKQEWMMSKPSPWITPSSPLRLTISVPFLWEEKPGKPIPQLLTYPSTVRAEEEFHDSSTGDGSSYNEDWYSLSETDGNGSSETDDASALKFLFPLSPPSVGFLSRVRAQASVTLPAHHKEKETKKSWTEDCGRVVVKRTLTLEELILLSRKLSYRRKAVIKKEKKLSMEFIQKFMLTCFSARTPGHPETVPITSI